MMDKAKAIMEAVHEALRLHDDGLLMASDREWIRGMVLKDVRRILTEQLGGCPKCGDGGYDLLIEHHKEHHEKTDKEITKRVIEEFQSGANREHGNPADEWDHKNSVENLKAWLDKDTE